METEPWKMVNHLFPDLVFLVEGKKLYYHQAVIAQHSELVRNILLKNNCCKCGGADCSRNAGNIFISLDDVKINTVQYVMDMIYAGSGSIAGDTDDYKSVLGMLQINTIVVDALDSLEGFVLEEILQQVGSNLDLNLDVMQEMLQGPVESSNEVNEHDNSKKIEKDLKETNKALKRLEKEKRKLVSAEEKKKAETDRKRDLRPKNKKQEVTADKNPIPEKELKDKVVKTVEDVPTPTNIGSKSQVISSVSPVKLDLEKPKKNQESKSMKDDVDCEIILDSAETIGSTVAKNSEVERYVCPFTDCHSESKNVQSIKVHLALVHYKKLIQSEFPNWKKQKCDECDKSFGQMTAYYLHMANHKKFQYMDLPAHAMVHKETMPIKSAETSITTTAKTTYSKRNPNNQAIMSKPALSTKAPSTTTTVQRNKAEVIPSSTSTTHVRSSSSSSGGRVLATKGSDSVGPSLTRSKSFIQPSKTPSHSAFQSKSIAAGTQSSSRPRAGSTYGTSFARTAPPGPPGPAISSATISRSNSFHKIPSSTSATASNNKSTLITSNQRRLSAPYSVVTKRAGSKEGPLASKDSKKSRGS